MNKALRIILITYTVLVAVCCIYMPWDWSVPTPGASLRIPLGYDWLWARPVTIYTSSIKASDLMLPPTEHDKRAVDLTERRNYTRISLERLAVELLALTVIGSSAFLLFWRRKTDVQRVE